MINKKSIWFLTLFSLLLVLSVYYITMPSELLISTNGNYNENEEEKTITNITESTALVALRVEAEEELLKEMENLQLILNGDGSIEEKNQAFDKMKQLNMNKGEQEKLENKIKEIYKLESVVKIKNNQIEITVRKEENNLDLANKIMRTIQELYEEEKYITVKFIK